MFWGGHCTAFAINNLLVGSSDVRTLISSHNPFEMNGLLFASVVRNKRYEEDGPRGWEKSSSHHHQPTPATARAHCGINDYKIHTWKSEIIKVHGHWLLLFFFIHSSIIHFFPTTQKTNIEKFLQPMKMRNVLMRKQKRGRIPHAMRFSAVRKFSDSPSAII